MKKSNITLSIALATIFSASVVTAAEVSGKLVIERAVFTNAGSVIGNTPTFSTFGTGGMAHDATSAAAAPGIVGEARGCNMMSPTQANPATSGYCGAISDANGGKKRDMFGNLAGAPTHGDGDVFKEEVVAKIFIDGDAEGIAEGATYHVELNAFIDNKATSNYNSNQDYTQRDFLREAYVDMEQGDWSIRAGKQQVVWGTADGMKLLDMINPSDYGEMAQNQMEDSRVPVWMFNAETTGEDGTETQIVVSQPKENVFAGLNRNVNTDVRGNNMFADDTTLNGGTDTGHAFMMKGPDTITGGQDGFLNIVPDLGSVAARFGMAFTPSTTTGSMGATSYYGSRVSKGNLNVASMQGFTVTGFEAMTMLQMNQALGGATTGAGSTIIQGASGVAGMTAGFATAVNNTYANLLIGGYSDANFNADVYAAYANGAADATQLGYVNAAIAAMAAAPSAGGMGIASATNLTGSQMLAYGFDPLYDTNLANVTAGNDTAFDYMGNTTFRTFDAFVDAKSQYAYAMPNNSDFDLAIRTKKSLASGLNYSLNASYNYDKNPIIDLSWRGDNGQVLTTYTSVCPATMCGQETTTVALYDAAFNTAATKDAGGFYDYADGAYGGAAIDAAQGAYIVANSLNPATMTDAEKGAAYVASQARAATLRFTEEVKRVVNIGGSFDMAVETASLGPVVIRGEVLYTKGAYSPVIDKTKLGYGDLVGALEMKKGDRAKFVLGADITALTNMMVSAQFIQDSDLDFIDGAERYTADYATMSLNNEFNKGIKDKNFYSLFFSKPFGASGEHRWNNITMYEEGNGNWNRFDIDYSIDDDTQATLEYNKYWGNANTQFGQLEASSNIQVGVKYSF